MLERYLTVRLGLGVLAGVGLGLWMPDLFASIAGLRIAHFNRMVAVFIWVMIYPMMIQIDGSSVKNEGQRRKGARADSGGQLVHKPFTMTALGVIFFQYIFTPWVDPQSASEYIAGMILWSVVPCTTMAFVWNQLVKGDAN